MNKDFSSTPFSYHIFLLLTFVLIGRPQEVFPVLQQMRPALIFTIVSVMLAFYQSRNPITAMLNAPLGKKYLAFYGIMLFGIPFALHRKVAFDFAVLQYSTNILYFGLLISHIDSLKKMKALILTIVVSIFFLGLASFKLGTSLGGRFAFGTMYDANDLAYLLVSLVPFAAFFFSKAEKLFTKLLAGITIVISLLLILLTASRGGLIGLLVMILLLLFTKLSPVKRSIKIIALIGILIFAIVNKDMIFTERNATLMNLDQDYNAFDETGRIKIWKKALLFSFENPITGVGAQCFPMAIGMERKNRNVQEVWQAVHNAYLEISSELGLIAFTIFFLMIKGSFQVFNKARFSSGGQMIMSDVQRLSGIAQIALICHLIVATFLTQGYSLLFTLFFALAAVVDKTQRNNLGGWNEHSV